MPNQEQYSIQGIVSLIAEALVKIGKNDLKAAVSRLEFAIRLIRLRASQKK